MQSELANLDRVCVHPASIAGTTNRQGRDKWRWEVAMTDDREMPPVGVIMDAIEFCWQSVPKLDHVYYDTFCDHSHMVFDRRDGQVEFEYTELDLPIFLQSTTTATGRFTSCTSIKANFRACSRIPRPIGIALRDSGSQSGDAEIGSIATKRRCPCGLLGLPVVNEQRDALEKLM